MTESLHAVLEALPQTSLTTHILDALDTLVPGEWRNITVFEGMVKDVTSETDDALIQQVGERAMQLFADESNGYQRAVTVYKGSRTVSPATASATSSRRSSTTARKRRCASPRGSPSTSHGLSQEI